MPNYLELPAYIGYQCKGTAIHTAINKGREVVFETLSQKWLTQRPRPQLLFRLAICHFGNRFFDFRVPKAIGPLSTRKSPPPHYARFIGGQFAGSEHDYTWHKGNSATLYGDYFRKSPQEKRQLSGPSE